MYLPKVTAFGYQLVHNTVDFKSFPKKTIEAMNFSGPAGKMVNEQAF